MYAITQQHSSQKIKAELDFISTHTIRNAVEDLCYAFDKGLIKNKSGSIVLTTSASVLFGVTGGNGQGGPAYVSSKGAVIGLMRSMARALGPDGIRVNAVSPGITDTPMVASYTKEQKTAMRERFPLRRFAKPKEIAEGAIFLISDKASFMTGENMHINGGSNFGG